MGAPNQEKPITFGGVLNAGVRVAALAIASLPLQFTKSARMEIGERDSWTCQKCHGTFHGDNLMVHAAHYPAFHLRGHGDPDPEAGRILCVRDHLLEHLDMYTQDQSDYNYHSLRLITKLAFTQGYHTWNHYIENPQDRITDQDQVVQDLADYGIALGQFITP